MEMRYPAHPDKVKTYTTDQLRSEFLIENLFVEGAVNMVYSHIDRIITGGAAPTTAPLALTGDPKELGADFFLQRREMGVVNVGGAGTVTIDGGEQDQEVVISVRKEIDCDGDGTSEQIQVDFANVVSEQNYECTLPALQPAEGDYTIVAWTDGTPSKVQTFSDTTEIDFNF